VRGGDRVTVDTARATSIKALEDAIEAFIELIKAKHEDCDDVIAVDAALVVGVQWITDDGERRGNVMMLPRNGSHPAYITIGLFAGAEHNMNESSDDD
jgi:hypothetical protein